MKNYGAMSSFRFLASFRVTSAPATAFATVFATISALVLVGTALLAPPAFADPPWHITSEDGESSLRFRPGPRRSTPRGETPRKIFSCAV